MSLHTEVVTNTYTRLSFLQLSTSDMKHAQKPNAFTIPVRIYYEDTDAGGVAFITLTI